MHISLEHIGAPLEVGTKISVFWKEDDDWHNGLIDAYDPISNVHGVLYFDGEREESILEDETLQIVSYPRLLADMIYQRSDVLSGVYLGGAWMSACPSVYKSDQI